MVNSCYEILDRYVTIIHNDNLHNLLTDMSNKEGGIPNEAKLENF